MHYIKSRTNIQKAAKARMSEAQEVAFEAKKTLGPVMTQYGIETPEEIADRLVAAHAKGGLKVDTDVERLIETLTRYDKAMSAMKELAFVAKHINTFGADDSMPPLSTLPVEWDYVQMTQHEVDHFFEPYLPMADGLGAHGRDVMLRAANGRGMGIDQLGRIQRNSEIGMTTALRG